MQIILQHNTTNFTRYFDEIDVVSNTPLHTQIELDLTMLLDGEYTLTLLSNTNDVLCQELVQIGDNTIKNYNREKKYIQYARK